MLRTTFSSKRLLAAIPFLLLAACLIAVLFFPKAQAPAQTLRVIRVWNVDTFEGGKGSRTAFLRRAAHTLEGKREGVYYLVTSYTAEGALAAYEKGEKPDVLSFGVGLGCFSEACLPLPLSFSGGKAGEESLAVPWCRGRYLLFSRDEVFGEAGRTAISSGGSNLASVAAVCSDIEGEETEAVAAYTGFLSGKYRYLLGTQRDVCRFAARGVQVYSRPLTAYNDLYQYFAVLSEQKREDCLALLYELRSPSVQAAVEEIGMLALEGDESKRTVSVFSDENALVSLRESAAARDEKNIDKFLKTI